MAVANVHARAVASRVRDGMGGEVLLGFSNSPAAPVTVVGKELSFQRDTHPVHLGRRSRSGHPVDDLPALDGMTLLPGPVRMFRQRITDLVLEHDVCAVCYTRGHPDRMGRIVRTVGVWPEELVAVTYLTDVTAGVKVDPALDVTAVTWEDWLARLIPVRRDGLDGP